MSKKFILLLVALSGFVAGAVNANDGLNKQALPVAKGREVVLNKHLYEIQPQTSKMQFRVDSPIGEIWARFEDFEGDFVMLNTDVAKKPAMIDINADSLDTDSSLIAVMLKGESFFDVDSFPSMSFVGSSFEWFSDKQAILKGDMTIKGVTRQVAFYVELVSDAENKHSDRITVKASTTIKRSEFGIFSLLPVVSDNVNLFMSIDAQKRHTAVSMIE